MHISCLVIKLWSLAFKSEIEEKAFCFSNLLPQRDVAKILTFLCQCITGGQRMVRYPFVHYSALFLCTFSVFHCGNLYFFMLHFSVLRSFHVGLFSYGTICMLHCLYSNIFMLHFFSCWTLFMYCTIRCTFTRCNDFVFHYFLVAVCACCSFSCCCLFIFH